MSGETKAHMQLKRAALFWAQVQGYAIAAPEVRVPNSNYRADVAGYKPLVEEVEGEKENGQKEKLVRRPAEGISVIFECKQSRPDFLNDSRPEDESLRRLEELHERRSKLEKLLGMHYPSLAKGESLFPEYESYALEEVPHEGYRGLVREIRVLENRVYGKTKFDRLVRYRCAHLHYLVTRPGVMQEHEVPLDWGWLELNEAEADGVEEESVPELVLRKKPRLLELPAGRALALLHQLGRAGTKRINEEAGVCNARVWEARRKG